MKKLILLILIIFLIPVSAFGISIYELFNIKETVKEVVVRGEAIGDIMVRGEKAWINIKDETGAIGIWAPKIWTEKIKVTGDYKNTGDLIEVEGIYFRQCQFHGGDSDIHATKIKIINEGYERDKSIMTYEISLAMIALITFLFIYFVRRFVIARRAVQINK